MNPGRSKLPATGLIQLLLNGFETCRCWPEQPQQPVTVILAVSGGADSMALLHATLQLCQPGTHPTEPRLPLQLHAVHVNHQLRGLSSDEDARFVHRVCHELKVNLTCVEADVARIQQDSAGESLEETARRVRYDILLQTARQLKASAVATAHHQDDQAETVLHNILRGTGLRGLAAMPRRRLMGDELCLIRPMLNIRRSEILDFVQKNEIPFREDESNLDPRFLRNRIRHDLLPKLHADFNRRTSEHLIALSEQAAGMLACMDSLADQVIHEAVLERSQDSCRIDRSKIRQWPSFLITHSLMRIWALQHWPQRQMNASHWAALTEAAHHGVPSAISLPGAIQATVRDNLLQLRKT